MSNLLPPLYAERVSSKIKLYEELTQDCQSARLSTISNYVAISYGAKLLPDTNECLELAPNTYFTTKIYQFNSENELNLVEDAELQFGLKLDLTGPEYRYWTAETKAKVYSEMENIENLFFSSVASKI